MDVRMPELDGISATAAIKREMPEVAVVMVTMHDSDEYVMEAMQAGASGYILKDATQAELVGSVRGALPARRRD